MTLPEIAIRRPIATLMALISVAVIGTIALYQMPLAFLPDNDEPQLWVVVEYPNASPPVIERTILRPLEEALGSLKGLRNVWSNCDQDGARVSLNFRWGTNIGMARVEVRDRIERLKSEFPTGVERIHISSGWDPKESGETIMEARLSSGRDLSKDYELLDRKIIRPLQRIPGVAQVILDGVNPNEVRINLKLEALERHNVDIRRVREALRSNNEDRSLGVIRTDERSHAVRVLGSFLSVDEIKNLEVGDSVRLGDVADVTYKDPPLEYGRHLDGKFAVGVSVAKEASGNTVAISDEIHRRVKLMGEDPELSGINFLVWEDQGKEIRKTIGDLKNTGLIGAILASIVLFLFLRRMSTTVVAVSCIPLSLIAACGVIWAQGKSLNTLTLLGLIVGVGMLVDNAVVVMENIERYRAQGMKRRVAALIGAREVSTAVVAATMTSVIVFLPMIFSRPSEMNILLRELGLTVCYTLIASLVVSQTLIPLAAGHFINPKKSEPGRLMLWLQERYSRLLAFTLAHKWLAPLVGLLVIGSAVYPFMKIDKNFDANETEMFVAIRYKLERNIPLDQKEELITGVEQLLEPYREELNVDSVYSFWSDRWVMTRIYMEEGHTTVEEMANVRKRLREIVPRIPGVRLEVQDSGQFWRRNRGKRIGFKLTGADSEVLSRISEEARVELEQIEGLSDIYNSSQEGRDELHATLSRDRAREYGIEVEQPAEVVELTFRGRRLPRFNGPDGEVEMRLHLDEDEVVSVAALKNLSLQRNDGVAVPFESIAEFKLVKGPERIQRDNGVTGVWFGGRYEEGLKEDYVAQGRKALAGIVLPYGYAWDWQAMQRDSGESQKEFITNLCLALGLIFAVMAGLFESVRQAISLLISLPFAVTGAIWALYLTGTDFDQPASVGLLLLLGIVVNNGIVMVEHINHHRRRGLDRAEAMLLGGRERLRPIIMTAVTTLLGLVPIVVQKPSLAGVYYYSMALVVMGGLIVSTFLTTVLLPTTIAITEDTLGWLFGLPRRFARSTARAIRRRAGAAESEAG